MPTYTREQMDRLAAQGCAECGTALNAEHGHELYLHSRCHPASPTWAVYLGDGNLLIQCAVCRNVVVLLEVK